MDRNELKAKANYEEIERKNKLIKKDLQYNFVSKYPYENLLPKHESWLSELILELHDYENYSIEEFQFF